MPRRCTACEHARRQEIDGLLLDRAPLSRIAREFGLSPSALFRHKHRHLSGPVAAAMRAREEASVGYYNSLAAKVEEAQHLARAEYDAASPGSRVRLDALDRVLKSIQLEIQHSRPAGGHTTINILTHPDWIRLKDTIIAALGPFPEAARAVHDALDAILSASAAAGAAKAPATLGQDRLLPPGEASTYPPGKEDDNGKNS